MSGPFGSTPHNLFNTTASDFYNGVINQSLRFEEGGTHYLDFTPAQDAQTIKDILFLYGLNLLKKVQIFALYFHQKMLVLELVKVTIHMPLVQMISLKHTQRMVLIIHTRQPYIVIEVRGIIL